MRNGSVESFFNSLNPTIKLFNFIKNTSRLCCIECFQWLKENTNESKMATWQNLRGGDVRYDPYVIFLCFNWWIKLMSFFKDAATSGSGQ